jgi:hypothetical protein
MTPTIAPNAPIDLQVLLESRLLVQANSGGGKSWALRRLLEQTAPLVQQLVIDPEGEFSTLREKFDYVIAAPHDGDALATPQTAALLARRLLESGVSAILDIYDLKAHERILFVRRFLEALVNAPKSLWRPVLIALDEAHVYAPQVGSAESLQAVSDIATRGRKRGQCLLAATQRLSKLHKDVAAELGNKMIGRTGLDVDVKRAADELGLTSREATDSLRNLAPGEFYIFGPALSRAVERVRVGPVATPHPKAGNRMMQAPPAPSPKLRSQLAKLADLQKEAEKEASTIEDLRAENAKLKRDVAAASKRSEPTGVPEPEVRRRIAEAVAAVPRVSPAAMKALAALPPMAAKLAQHVEAVYLDSVRAIEQQASAPVPPPQRNTHPVPAPRERAAARIEPPQSSVDGQEIGQAERRILDSIAWWEAGGIESPQVLGIALAARYTVNGHFRNTLGALRSKGLIASEGERERGTEKLTDAGRVTASAPNQPPTRDELLTRAVNLIRGEPARRVFEPLIAGATIPVDELAAAAGYTVNGHYRNTLGSLHSMGLIHYPQRGRVQRAPIFETIE